MKEFKIEVAPGALDEFTEEEQQDIIEAVAQAALNGELETETDTRDYSTTDD